MKRIILLAILSAGILISTMVAAECPANRNPDITLTKPNSIYTDNGDGTVSDTITGLMWHKCPLGLSGNDCTVGTELALTWQAALAAANGNTDYGYSDWRLPNRNELDSLMEVACTTGINESMFPVSAITLPGSPPFVPYFVSSTPMASDPSDPFSDDHGRAWHVSQGVHVPFYKFDNALVRLVRTN